MIGYRNWNKEAMHTMVADLKGPWDNMRTDFQNQQHEVTWLIRTSWDEAIHPLRDPDWSSYDVSMDEICQAMRSRKLLFVEAAEDIFDTFESDLSTLETDALTGLDTSIFGTIMSEAYKKAMRDYGDGCDRRRKAVIASTLTDKTTFRSLISSFKERFNLQADNLQQVLTETVSTHLDGVRRTLDLVREQNVAEESERDPEFRNRVSIEVARVRRMMSM